MIYGIGADIVRVARMSRNLEQYGERFAERILTVAELEEFHRDPRPAQFLAKRFAAKEAAAKAMGTGFRDGIKLRHIGVAHDAAGRPRLEFSGQAAEFIRRQGISDIHLSMADERDHAIAFVTLGK